MWSVSAVSWSAGAPPHSDEAPLLLLKVSEQQAWRLHMLTVSNRRHILHCQPLSRNGPCLKGVAHEPLFCRKMILNNYLEALLNLQMIKCFSICTGVKEMLVYLYLIFCTDGSFQEYICTNQSFLCVKTAQLQSFLFDFTGHD